MNQAKVPVPVFASRSLSGPFKIVGVILPKAMARRYTLDQLPVPVLSRPFSPSSIARLRTLAGALSSSGDRGVPSCPNALPLHHWRDSAPVHLTAGGKEYRITAHHMGFAARVYNSLYVQRKSHGKRRVSEW